MVRGAWQAAVHEVTKSQTRLSDFTFTFHFRALEKEMATHSSVLAWRIPGTGEPGGLPSVGLHRVGHDWSDLAVAVAVGIFLVLHHFISLIWVLKDFFTLFYTLLPYSLTFSWQYLKWLITLKSRISFKLKNQSHEKNGVYIPAQDWHCYFSWSLKPMFWPPVNHILHNLSPWGSVYRDLSMHS